MNDHDHDHVLCKGEEKKKNSGCNNRLCSVYTASWHRCCWQQRYRQRRRQIQQQQQSQYRSISNNVSTTNSLKINHIIDWRTHILWVWLCYMSVCVCVCVCGFFRSSSFVWLWGNCCYSFFWLMKTKQQSEQFFCVHINYTVSSKQTNNNIFKLFRCTKKMFYSVQYKIDFFAIKQLECLCVWIFRDKHE